MRDELIDLITVGIARYHIKKASSDNPDMAAIIADVMIEKGVIVPPMKLGQTCYEPCTYRNDVDECRVSSITQKADGSFKIRLTNLRGRWVFEITPDKIGKTVFLTKEEAERVLKGADDEN